jgi:hypothetical protein
MLPTIWVELLIRRFELGEFLEEPEIHFWSPSRRSTSLATSPGRFEYSRSQAGMTP